MSKRTQSLPTTGESPDLPPDSEAPATEFLFVNRDQATIGHTTRSYQISSHVQTSHRRRSPVDHGAKKSNEPPSPASELLEAPRRGGEIQPWRVDRPLREREGSHKAHHNPATGLASPQEPIVFPIQTGNSDPLAALPNTVDAVTNRILSWFRDHGLPARFPLERKVFGPSSGPSVRRAWNRTIGAMQFSDRAQSHIASVCALMAQRTESDVIYSLALQLKGKAYTVLRQRLVDQEWRHDLDTWRMILDMFWAEQNTGNTPAAETHLKLLADWVKDDAAPVLDADFRIELLAADNVLAGAKLGMPLIDTLSLGREDTVATWRAELQDRDNAATASTFVDLDETVSDFDLQSTFFRLRELAAVAELTLSGRIRSYSVFQWLALRLLSCESILLGSASADNGGSLDEPTTADRDFNQNFCASLTALAWICVIFVSECRQQKPLLAARLREAQLGCGLDGFDYGTASRSHALQLWSFYVGSLLEAKIQTETGRDEANTWQTRHFEHVAEGMYGYDWASMSKVLARFLHTKILTQLDPS